MIQATLSLMGLYKANPHLLDNLYLPAQIDAEELKKRLVGRGTETLEVIEARMNRAIEMLNSSEIINVDYGMVNDQPFFSTCGVGFDAVVAEKFSDTNRGLKGYVQTIFKDLFQYKPETYHLTGDGIDQTTTAFLVNFANAGQWGYDAYIAPKASVQDGWLDVAIVSEFPMTAAAGLALSLFTKNIDEKLHMNTRAR